MATLVREEWQLMLLERYKTQQTFILAFRLLWSLFPVWNVIAVRIQVGPFSKPLHQPSIFLIKTCMLVSFSFFSLYWNYCSRLKFWCTCQWSDHIHHCIAPYYTLPRNVQHLLLLFMGFLPGLNKADRTRQIVPGSAASCVSQASKNPLCLHMAYCGQLQESYTEYFLENDFLALPFSHISEQSQAEVCTFVWDDRKYSQTNNK